MFSERVQGNRRVALLAATSPGSSFCLRGTPAVLRADRELAFAVVANHPWVRIKAAHTLSVFDAVQSDANACRAQSTIECVAPALRADRTLVLAAVRASAEVFGMMLSFCDGECCFWRALSYSRYWKACTLLLCVTIGNTRVQGMEVHASDREIVEAAVTQDGKLRAHNCGRGATCWCAFFMVTAISNSENG